MTLRRWFGRQERSNESNPFANWPSAPDVRLPQLDRLSTQKAMKQAAGKLEPDKYDHALMIGLGETGHLVLQSWLDRLRRDPAGYQQNLRSILVTDSPIPEIVTDRVKFRQFDLRGSTSLSSSASEVRSQSTRARVRNQFVALPHFGPIWSYLNTAVRELVSDASSQTDIRIFLVASIEEVEIGLLGDLLQALHAIGVSGGHRFANVTLLLALNSPVPALDISEQIAALREIGRFTFSGRHLMGNVPYVENPTVDGALLDYVFLFETDEAPEALVETLFTLLHPAATPIWENLRNDLSQTSSARNDSHLPLVHSLGIASLFVPVDEIKQYVASRLAYAALFGEIGVSEGLVSAGRSLVDYSQRGGAIAHDWLTKGPGRHSLWPWLLNVKGPQHLRIVPELDDYDAYHFAFQSQLAQGIVRLLNDEEQVNHLLQTRAGLRWLLQHLHQVREWCIQATPRRQGDKHDQLTLLSEELTRTVDGLLRQITEWEAALGVPTVDENKDDVSERYTPGPLAGGDPRSSAKSNDWRETLAQQTQSGDWRKLLTPVELQRDTDETVEDVDKSLRQRLAAHRRTAEISLTTMMGGSLQRPLTYRPNQPLHEVEQYYEDTIRPELIRHGLEASPRFRRVRQRLGWWIDLPRNRLPELMLICLPANLSGPEDAIPPPDSRFRHDNVSRLTNTLLDIALAEVQTVAPDLTGQWMIRRLSDHHLQGFLSQAAQPLLTYDQAAAMTISQYASSVRRYLIGRDRSLIPEFKEAAFRNVSAADVNEVPDAEPYVLTALGLRLNIPLVTIDWFNQKYDQYDHQGDTHLYPPEQLATRYENNLSRVRRERYEFPPELVLTLTDERLVSLFCQALFAGYIVLRKRESIRGQIDWTLLPSDPAQEAIPLALADGTWRGLWQAMRQFTLDLPYGSIARTQPAHPFYPTNRSRYLKALEEAVREARRDATRFYQKYQEFESAYLMKWEANLQGDRLGRAFIDLLKIEQRRPLWRGW